MERDGVIERMKKDLQSFSNANLSELKPVVDFYEGYIGEEAVNRKNEERSSKFFNSEAW